MKLSTKSVKSIPLKMNSVSLIIRTIYLITALISQLESITATNLNLVKNENESTRTELDQIIFQQKLITNGENKESTRVFRYKRGNKENIDQIDKLTNILEKKGKQLEELELEIKKNQTKSRSKAKSRAARKCYCLVAKTPTD